MPGTRLGCGYEQGKNGACEMWGQEIPPLKERKLCIQREPEWRGDERANMQMYMILASFVVCAF